MKSGLLISALLLTCWLVPAEENHHETLTPAQLGMVHFPTSCAPAVRTSIERGVALLHSFWYEEAEKQFTAIAKQDPNCAMAHWGVAMSLWHQLWNRPDRATIEHGLAQLKQASALSATPRERGYVSALEHFYDHPGGGYQKRANAYCEAMGKVSRQNPSDHEAAAFYALSLLAAEPENDKHNRNRKTAAEVLEKLFALEPNHPGVAHYLIHTYDTPEMAQQGLPAARRYAQIAPAAPHALHMPSHIFARLGLWQEDIASNLASIQATRKEAAQHLGGEGHQFHAMDYLVYAYLQSGREQQARTVIEELRTMPAIDDMYNMGFDARLFALSTFTAGYELELHHWREAAQLSPVPGAARRMRAATYAAQVIGSAHSRQAERAHQAFRELERMAAELSKDDRAAVRDVQEQMASVRPWVEYADGKSAQALKSLRRLALKDQAVSEISEGVPEREMLADLLLELARPEEALLEYQAELKINPGRFNSLYGAAQAAERAGKKEQANAYYTQLVSNCDGARPERHELEQARAAIEEHAGQGPQAGFEGHDGVPSPAK
jgi:hypothetical protein